MTLGTHAKNVKNKKICNILNPVKHKFEIWQQEELLFGLEAKSSVIFLEQWLHFQLQ